MSGVDVTEAPYPYDPGEDAITTSLRFRNALTDLRIAAVNVQRDLDRMPLGSPVVPALTGTVAGLCTAIAALTSRPWDEVNSEVEAAARSKGAES